MPKGNKNAASEETLSTLHSKLAEALTKRIDSGEATAADLAAAAKFLKDNGITSPAPENDERLGALNKALTDKLPFPERPN